MLLRVDTPHHFVAGVIVTDKIITDTAPILRWAIGRHVDWFTRYCKTKKWKVEEC